MSDLASDQGAVRPPPYSRHQFLQDLADPFKALRRMHVPLPDPSIYFDGSEPYLLRYALLFVVADALSDHGLLDRKSMYQADGRLQPPSEWKLKRGTVPARTLSRLQDWLIKEWRKKHSLIGCAGAWMRERYEGHIRAEVEPALAAVGAIVYVRNDLASRSGLDATEHTTSDGKRYVPEYPEVVDYVIALDNAIDRLCDKLRMEALRRLMSGTMTDEQRTAMLDALQVLIDKGMWPNWELDCNEVWGPPEPIQLFPQRAEAND